MKRILLLLLFNFSIIAAFGQAYGNAYFKSTHIINSDSTHGELNGTEYINADGKFRYKENGTWYYRANTASILSTIGTINGATKSSNGGVISGSSLFFQTADDTYPGLVSTGAQTFAGAKTFLGNVVVGGTTYSVDPSVIFANESSATYFRAGRLVGGRAQSGYGVIGDGFTPTTTAGVFTYYGGTATAMVDFTAGNIALKTAPAGTHGTAAPFTTKLYVSNAGNVGIGTATPNAPLQFANGANNRKLVLQEIADNDHQVSALGIGASGEFLFRTPDTGRPYIWYAGASAAASNELMRLTGDGKLVLSTTPSNDDTQTQVLVRNSSTGAIQYRTASSLLPGDIYILKSSLQDDATFASPSSTNVPSSSSVKTYVDTQVAAVSVPNIQTAREMVANLAANSSATYLISWPTAFPNTNYTVSISMEDYATTGASDGLEVIRFESKTASSITVVVRNRDTVLTDMSGEIHAIAIAD